MKLHGVTSKMSTSAEDQRERMTRVFDYTNHRLAEMNGVVGRLQSVSNALLGFSVAILAVIFGLGIEDQTAFLAILVATSILLLMSLLMIRVTMIRRSHTVNLGLTPWFYRGNISFDPKIPSAYDRTSFNEDKEKFKQLICASDETWDDYYTSQILQLFMTCSVRMYQISEMRRIFYWGLGLVVLSLAVIPILSSVLPFLSQFLL